MGNIQKNSQYLVTARMQMVARKHPETTIQPQPPSGAVMTPDILLPPSSFSALVTAITSAPLFSRLSLSINVVHFSLMDLALLNFKFLADLYGLCLPS